MGKPAVVGFATASGDFNKDGKADLAVVLGDSTNNVAVFLGNGDGTFKPASHFTVSAFPTAIAVADVNNDGNPDLLTNDAASEFNILLGNGDGSFETAILLAGSVGYPFAAGKFGSDTNIDLVGGQSIFTLIRRGNPDGTFQNANFLTISTSESPTSFAVADMNNDGKLDIVAGTISTDLAHIAVLLSDANAAFPTIKSTVSSTNNSALITGDFDKDGKIDVAAGNYINGKITIFMGNGDGTLRSNAVYTVSTKLLAIASTDFTGDGTNDLAVVTGSALTIFVGHGDGTFEKGAFYNGLWQTLAVADFNADGKMDIAANVQASGKIGISLGNGDGTFQVAPHYLAGVDPQSVTMGDLNADGHTDLAIANFGGNNVSVLLNNGDGTFAPRTNYATAPSPQSIAIADFNRDGTNDLVVTTSNGTNQLSVLLGNGKGTFRAPINYGSFGGGPIAVADFNHDGKIDVLANSLLTGMQVQLGNATGSFIPAATGSGLNAFTYGPGTLAVGEFNGDTNLDFVLVAFGGTNVSVSLGAANGTFLQPPQAYTTGTNSQAVATGDFNNDGKLDLAVADSGSFSAGDGSISILLGNGNGTFQTAIHYFAGPDPVFVTTLDFNGDGKLDLAVRGFLGLSVAVLHGNGDGTFAPPIYFGALNDSLFGVIAIGDLNGDGKPDAAVLNLDATVSIMLGTCTMSAPPALAFGLSNSSIDLSWPALSSGGLSLQSTTSLTLPDWSPATGSLETNNGVIQIKLPHDARERYFRLH
ncbi:MAG TPA: VCBS repeat-containing protein [Verrucomicrobiae bacterium]|nr:VCBS repeat-containing protein [Verrucomicrobiae bacterium]